MSVLGSEILINDQTDDSFNCNDSHDDIEVPESIVQAREEWKEIDKQQEELDKLHKEIGVGGIVIDRSTPMTYFDTRLFLIEQSSRLNSNVPQIVFSSKNCCCFPKGIPFSVSDGWKELYLSSRLAFDENDVVHHRILNSLHSSITGIKTPPPRKGSHWTDVGFQSEDPIKDLRSTGMLGLALPLAVFSKFKPFGQRVISISRSPDHPFPLMLIMIVFVGNALDVAKNTDLFIGVTDKEGVWNQIVYFLAGSIYQLCLEWVRDGLDFIEDYQRIAKIMKNASFSIKNTIDNGILAENEETKSIHMIGEDGH